MTIMQKFKRKIKELREKNSICCKHTKYHKSCTFKTKNFCGKDNGTLAFSTQKK